VTTKNNLRMQAEDELYTAVQDKRSATSAKLPAHA